MITDILIVILIFFFGASIGSFCNALAERLFKEEDFIKSRSHCDECGKTLQPQDLVPVFSFLWLNGKCRYCKAKLPIDLVVSEIILGALYIAAYFIAYPLLLTDITMFYMYFLFLIGNITFFFFIAIYDFKYYLIPDFSVYALSIFYTVLIVGIFILHLFGFNLLYYSNYTTFLLQHLITGIVLFLFFFMIYAITKGRGIGGGDVKLSYLIGILLGARPTIIFLYIAFFAGALVSVFLLLTKARNMKDAIPFGPFLSLGVIITLLFGAFIINTPLFNFINYFSTLFST